MLLSGEIEVQRPVSDRVPLVTLVVCVFVWVDGGLSASTLAYLACKQGNILTLPMVFNGGV